MLNFMNFRYFKLDLSNLSQLNSFQIGLLINQPNIEKLGIKKSSKVINLEVYFKIYEIEGRKITLDDQINALVEIFNKKGFKCSIVKKLPELISL